MTPQKSKMTFETTGETYIVEGIEGEGGSAVVYRVIDSEGRPWALKRLRPEQATATRTKRFMNELHFCEKSVHKNVIKVVDEGFVLTGGAKCPFFVMPLYSSTLRKFMADGGKAGHVLPCFSQVLDGVEAAHLQKVLHRDLKPENILHDPASSQFVVSDFGIAHFNSELMLALVETDPRERLANARYAAPEQLNRNGTVDERADIYSLGLILNEMFTGHVPHGAGFATIAAVAPQFGYLDELVESMVQQDPNKRPRSIDEIKRTLIARRNDFVERQRLDELKKMVVPASKVSHPFYEDPPRVIDCDVEPRHRRLTMVLNKRVPGEWVEAFRTPRNMGFIRGTGPDDWSFDYSADETRTEAHVTVGPRDLEVKESTQTIIDNFKSYVEFANHAFLRNLERSVQVEEERKKRELQDRVAYEEERRRLRAGLKI